MGEGLKAFAHAAYKGIYYSPLPTRTFLIAIVTMGLSTIGRLKTSILEIAISDSKNCNVQIEKLQCAILRIEVSNFVKIA